MGVTNYIWDELSDNLLMETDENNVPTAVYTHRPERFGQLISQERSGTTSYFIYDGANSTRLLTDDNEAITDTYIFSAYGELVARTGTTTNPFGYKGAVGYYTNSATDDIYVRARTYEPVTGRWLSMDPLGFVDGPNLYRAYFVPGSVDPEGTIRTINGQVFNPKDDVCDGAGRSGYTYGWELDKPLESRGYIIQRVEFSCKQCSCGPCGECWDFDCEEFGPFVFYEAWLFEGSHQKPVTRPTKPPQSVLGTDDRHTYSGMPGICFKIERKLEARFFRTRRKIEEQAGWTEDGVVYGQAPCSLIPVDLPNHGGGPPDEWIKAGIPADNYGERIVSDTLIMNTNCCGEGQSGGTYEFPRPPIQK